MRRETHSAVSQIFCMTKTSDEGPYTVSPRKRGESSRGSRSVEGRSQEARGGELDLPELDQARRRGSDDGPI